MATKNVYECDTVAAMLLHSLLVTKQPATARKAAKELRVSEEDAYLFDVLTLAWLLMPADLPTESAACAAFVAGDCGALLVAATTVVVAVALPPLPFPRAFPELPTDSPAALRRAVGLAVGRGDVWRAAFLVMGAHVNRGDVMGAAALVASFGAPPRLVELLRSVAYAPLCGRVLEHAFAACCAASSPTAMLEPFVGTTEKPGALRGARGLRIDAAALATWGVTPRPLTRLRGFPRLVAEGSATAYWRHVCAAHGAAAATQAADGLSFPDDDACEAFYSTYFPDDIPDEWSAADQLKSHGLAVDTCTARSPWATALSIDCVRAT